MAGTIKFILILSCLISTSMALTEIEDTILNSDIIPQICATVAPSENNDLLQFLCAVLAVRAGNFLSAPRVTSYSTPAYASFAARPFSAPALAYPTQAFSSYGAPTYSSYASAPFVTKNYGQVSSYSTQNAPVTYSRPTIVAAAPVNAYTASSYSNYPQRTPITTFSTSGPGTYTYPLSYSSQVPVTTYTTSPVLESGVTYTTAPAVSYNGLTANIRL